MNLNNLNQNESGLPNHNVVPREGSSVSLCFLSELMGDCRRKELAFNLGTKTPFMLGK